MAAKLVNVGFGNMVAIDRVIAIVDPGSAPMKRLKDEAMNREFLNEFIYGDRDVPVLGAFRERVLLISNSSGR